MVGTFNHPTSIVANGCFWIIKSSFLIFGTKLARDQQKINQCFWWFFGFCPFYCQKKHEKVSKSSNADKNGQGEYQIINFRHFRQSGDFLDTIGPCKSLCYVLKRKLYLKLLRFCAPLIPPKIAKKCQLYMIYRPSCTEVPISQVPSRTKSFISQVLDN